MKRYLFFLRHFNDIDNITPAIYFLLESTSKVRADVMIYSWDYDFRNDRNLALLTERFGERVSVEWLGRLLGIPYAACGSDTIRWTFKLGRFVAMPEKDLDGVVRGWTAQEKLKSRLKDVLSHAPEKILFDQNRASAVGGLLTALRSLGADRIVTLPVSPWTNVNALRQTDFVRLDSEIFRRKHDYEGFDAIGVVDEYYPTSLARLCRLMGSESPLAGKYQVLGSLRFTPEWLGIRQQIVPAFESTVRRPRLLFLLSAPKTNAFWEEALRTVQFFDNFPEYSVVVKPHTRYSLRPPEGRNVTIASGVDTSALIEWADIVLFWGTSVALEGYAKGKYMVCLDYINGNRSVYAMHNAGNILTCRDDLFEVLTLFAADPEKVAYSQQNVDRLLHAVVQGGRDGSVARRYIDYITDSRHGKVDTENRETHIASARGTL